MHKNIRKNILKNIRKSIPKNSPKNISKNIRKKMQKNKYVGADELEAMGEEEIFSKAAAILKEKNISIEGPKPTEHGAVFASRVHTKFMTFLTEM